MRTKRSVNYQLFSAVALILLVTATGCGQSNENPSATLNPDSNTGNSDNTKGNRNRGGNSGNSDPVTVKNLTPSGELSDAEAEGLLFMREEEKLARDVYLALYDLWGSPVFSNIAQSESAHMEAVLTLLNAYGLEDPAAATGEGEFINTDLQVLYNRLVAEGEQSLAEALRVGAAIEEIDILDLEERIAQTDKVDIINVYNNLLKGSSNHLRAFVSNLERQTGEDYVPQYLNLDMYDKIIQGTAGRGGSGKGGRGGSQGSNPNLGTP